MPVASPQQQPAIEKKTDELLIDVKYFSDARAPQILACASAYRMLAAPPTDQLNFLKNQINAEPATFSPHHNIRRPNKTA
jgi:hypothetical protein